jgi:phytoene synthase
VVSVARGARLVRASGTGVGDRPGVEQAYRVCASITRRQAGNFHHGIRLLPPQKRRALCAVYAFARRVDDVGDGALPTGEKLTRLGSIREDVAMLRISAPLPGATGWPDPVMVALADAMGRFPLPVASLTDLIDGVECDVRGMRYERFDDLVGYCRRVAGSIGQLSVSIFRATDPQVGAALADDLGVGMQLTNILRDVVEDRALGRLYIPVEDLERFGLDADTASGPSPATAELIRFEAARARGWFARGLDVLALLDRRSAACVGAMAGIYRRILARIDADPAAVFAGRISLPAWEKGWVAARSLAGARP